jgi:S1-C subfamily serine protease
VTVASATQRSFFRILAALAAAIATVASASAARSVVDAAAKASDAQYDRLVDATNAVVGVRVAALANARSNDTLGQERTGSGVVITKEGLVLTIGYLVQEADRVEVIDADGQAVPATVLACDNATGFGLLKPLTRLDVKPIAMGSAKPISKLDSLMIVTGGAEPAISIATVVSKRPFAGYWEYKIDEAIFTSPPRLDHSGAALINKDGELVGIGSLFVLEALTPGERLPGNMFVPVDLLKPVLEDLMRTGTQKDAHRPWLGVNSLEEDGRVKVLHVNDESPAEQAGIVAGDIILGVNGEAVASLETFYDKLWTRGNAGVTVVLTVLHGPTMRDIPVRSMERSEFMRHKPAV